MNRRERPQRSKREELFIDLFAFAVVIFIAIVMGRIVWELMF